VRVLLGSSLRDSIKRRFPAMGEPTKRDLLVARVGYYSALRRRRDLSKPQAPEWVRDAAAYLQWRLERRDDAQHG